MAMDRTLPLNAVRAFVAAARHASFTRAAGELGVTHGAVSKQVRLLEDHLGVPLFLRTIRQVSLTEAGRELLAGTAPALEQIGATAGRLRRAAAAQGAGGSVRINARPSFALRWLIPHLPEFMAAHPGIRPEVVTSTTEAVALPFGSYDVAIRRGASRDQRRSWPKGAVPRLFLRERARPVACPDLLLRRPVQRPEDLVTHTLLHTATRDGDWEAWLARARVPALKAAGDLRFEHLQFVLQAALDGLGIALAPLSLVAGDLSAGRLVSVLPRAPSMVLEPYCYVLAPDPGPSSRAFAEWLDGHAGRQGLV